MHAQKMYQADAVASLRSSADERGVIGRNHAMAILCRRFSIARSTADLAITRAIREGSLVKVSAGIYRVLVIAGLPLRTSIAADPLTPCTYSTSRALGIEVSLHHRLVGSDNRTIAISLARVPSLERALA